MMWRAAAAGLCVVLSHPPVRIAADPQQPTFRSDVDVITVNVSVRNRNLPVTGLAPQDFQITDNGVVQEVNDIDVDAVPVDVTLVLDTSGSTVSVLDQFRRDTREIVRMLRPFDRIRLLVIDTQVHEVFPLRATGGDPPLERLPGGGLSAVYDALVVALIAPTDPDRRRLIVVMTDGIDTYSGVAPEVVRQVAGQSDAVLHVMAASSGPQSRAVMGMDIGGHRTFPYYERHGERAFWGPFQPLIRAAYDDLNLDLLRQAAESTGGALQTATLFGGGAVSAFRRVLDDFRQSYLLRFTPTGVAREGWHDLVVTVPKSPKLTVRARRGYFVAK